VFVRIMMHHFPSVSVNLNVRHFETRLNHTVHWTHYRSLMWTPADIDWHACMHTFARAVICTP